MKQKNKDLEDKLNLQYEVVDQLEAENVKLKHLLEMIKRGKVSVENVDNEDLSLSDDIETPQQEDKNAVKDGDNEKENINEKVFIFFFFFFIYLINSIVNIVIFVNQHLNLQLFLLNG